LPTVAGLGLEPVDEIHHVVEPAAGAGADAASGDGDGKMALTGAGPADQHGVALLGNEVTTGEVTHERLVDRRALWRSVSAAGVRMVAGGPGSRWRARMLRTTSA